MNHVKKRNELDRIVIKLLGYHEFTCGSGKEARLIKLAYAAGKRVGLKKAKQIGH